MEGLVVKIMIEPNSCRNKIATLAIGDNYLERWQEYALPTWRLYCARHGIGLVVFESDLIAKDSRLWKKRQWQKLLIGDELQKHLPTVRNVCYLDTDILINYTAP